jgi:hypothetical protein
MVTGGRVVGTKHQKKLVTTDTIEVSNNFGVMLQRCYPSHKGHGPSTPNSFSMASKADVIPSDEEVSDAKTSLAALGTRLGGRFVGGLLADEERDFAAVAACQRRSGSEAEDNDNDQDIDITGIDTATAAAMFNGAGVRAQVRNTNRGARAGLSPWKTSTCANIERLPIDHLRFGMEALWDNMKLPRTAAYRFAATMGSFNEHNEWADELGAFVTVFRDEDMALKQALSPEYEAQTYLGIDQNSSCFVVLHGLRRWTPNPSSLSRNSGRLIAWEGETTQDGNPPDLWRLDDDEAVLFQLIPFSGVDLRKVSQFYSDEDNDKKFFGVGDYSHHPHPDGMGCPVY